MAYIRQRITILTLRKPNEPNINSELQWLGNSLGLFSLRDKDKSCFRLFIELLKSAKQHKPLSSDELGERLSLSRGTVIYHINRLIEAGLVIHEGRKYLLRVDSLASLVSEIQKDFQRVFHDLENVAEQIDKKMRK